VERIRVAAVLDTWIVSGPGRQLAALVGALAPLGVDLRIIMFQRAGREPSPFIAYLKGLGIEPTVIPERGPADLGALRGLAAALHEIRPHVVQSHGYRPTGLVSLLRLRRPPWRWIGFFHGATRQDLKDRLYNRLNLLMLSRAERLVVLSEEHRRWFAAMGDRVRIIHNAVLSLPPPPSPADFSSLRKPGTALIGVVARLSHEKGVDLAVEALASLRSRGLEVALAVAGDGPEEPNLRRRCEALGLADHVHFLGRVADVGALYRSVDLVMIPSRDGAEGLPNVLLEAISAGLPVVATRVAAVPEVLVDEAAGFVVPPGDAAALAAAAARALAPGFADQGREARRTVVGRFSLDQRAQRLAELYRATLASRI
jgi:glycosyltransferase involved in cell wall biosynthesis